VSDRAVWSTDRIQIAPSILSANFLDLGREVAAVERGSASLIHIDVMDGHFVPNITIGQPVVRAIKTVATCPLDVHLMIEDPDRYVDEFVDAGANMLSVHVEVTPHLHRTIAHIKSLGVRAGAVLNPSTPVSALVEIASALDFVLVMTVNPGFSGQAFIRQGLDKVRRVRDVLTQAGSSAQIEIDGGIDTTSAVEAVAAGASILVAGKAIFGTSNPEAATRALRSAANSAAGR
jgi:ribulose-phosphate 3-epimerase